MITTWKLANFRSIKDEVELAFSPLTLFAGSNSSGKSSLLKSILLIAQTLSQKAPSDPLELNGRLIRLGDFASVLNASSPSKILSIGWECSRWYDEGQHVSAIMSEPGRHHAKNVGKVACEIFVGPQPDISLPGSEQDSELSVYRVTLESLDVSIASGESLMMKERWRQMSDERSIDGALRYDIADSSAYAFWGYDFPTNYQASAIGCTFSKFMPQDLFLGEQWADEGGNTVFDTRKRPLPQNIADARDYMIDYFSRSIYYLGPLRANPKTVYAPSSQTGSDFIDLRGEHAAEILETNRGRIIRYIPPESLPKERPEAEACPLMEALIDWAGYLGIAEKITTVNKGRYGFELGVTMDNGISISDLTQVGVGVSQVLPILVTALLAPSDSTLIFEQPELHLHPKVQSRLADFFLSMTKLGKQCLVETHSEHIINRIRLRISESTGDLWQNAAKIYFVEKNGGTSTFQEIPIDEYGGIQLWPEGFFDEHYNETARILRAASRKTMDGRMDN